jgi:hypothetical protein
MEAYYDIVGLDKELKNVSELIELIDYIEAIEDMKALSYELGYEELCSTESVVEALIATERALDIYNVEVACG